MSAASQKALAIEQWKEMEGRKYRRRRGNVEFVAEKMFIDEAYSQHYNFVTVFYRFRAVNKGYTVIVNNSALPYDWVAL